VCTCTCKYAYMNRRNIDVSLNESLVNQLRIIMRAYEHRRLITRHWRLQRPRKAWRTTLCHIACVVVAAKSHLETSMGGFHLMTQVSFYLCHSLNVNKDRTYVDLYRRMESTQSTTYHHRRIECIF